jgi:hypothetical protein
VEAEEPDRLLAVGRSTGPVVADGLDVEAAGLAEWFEVDLLCSSFFSFSLWP